jgi:hypothetical protein
MHRENMDDAKGTLGYEKPEIKDYGDLDELTASQRPGNTSDVPTGTAGIGGFGSAFS